MPRPGVPREHGRFSAPGRPGPGASGPLPLALYDADCGFCTRWMGVVARRVPGVRVAALQASDLAGMGVDAGRAELEMPLVRSDGSVVYGHAAWADILRAAPPPVSLLGALLGSRALRRPAAWLYALVARNRGRLPGGSSSCTLP